MSFGHKSENQTQNTSTQPWAPTIGPLNDFIKRLGTLGGADNGVGVVTPEQKQAFGDLKDSSGYISGFLPDMTKLASDTFGAGSNSGMVTDAYKRLTDQLMPYASGGNIDVGSNPHIKQLLD